MHAMENEQADGFQQLEELCRGVVQRVSLMIESLPRPQDGAAETEKRLTLTCQCVESTLGQLRGVMERSRGLETALETERATAAQRDEAAASAAANIRSAEESIRAAEVKAAAAEASMETCNDLKRTLEEEREAVRKDKADLDKSVKEAREKDKAAKTLERQRAKAKEDVDRFRGFQDDLVADRERLREERRVLEGDVAEYNKAVAEYRQLKDKSEQELREEKARVGRRDEAIVRLKQDIQAGKQSTCILQLQSDHNAEILEKDKALADIELEMERAAGAELRLRMSDEYQGLTEKLDEMHISQRKTQESFHADTKGIKEAMVSATKNIAEGTTATKNLKTTLSPNTRAVKGLEEKIEDMKIHLQKMEHLYSTRQRDEAAQAEKHKVELIHEFESQARQQHEQDLAETRQQYETQLTELRTEKDEELAEVRQLSEDRLSELGTTKEELAKACQLSEAQLGELITTKDKLTMARQNLQAQLTTKDMELVEVRQLSEARLGELGTMEDELTRARQDLQAQLEELGTAKEELIEAHQLSEARLKELNTARGEELATVCQNLQAQLVTKDGELADLRQHSDARLKELNQARQELADARQRFDNDINVARKEAQELRMLVNQLRQQQGVDQAPPASPGPKRKKPRADGPQPLPQTPPPTGSKGDGAMRTDMARWQAALRSASEFWGSFEPRLIDQKGELNYEELLYQLRRVVRDEASRSRFTAFLQSDAEGWHCVERVVDPDSESAAGVDGGK